MRSRFPDFEAIIAQPKPHVQRSSARIFNRKPYSNSAVLCLKEPGGMRGLSPEGHLAQICRPPGHPSPAFARPSTPRRMAVARPPGSLRARCPPRPPGSPSTPAAAAPASGSPHCLPPGGCAADDSPPSQGRLSALRARASTARWPAPIHGRTPGVLPAREAHARHGDGLP
jgi:hypothetical protein